MTRCFEIDVVEDSLVFTPVNRHSIVYHTPNNDIRIDSLKNILTKTVYMGDLEDLLGDLIYEYRYEYLQNFYIKRHISTELRDGKTGYRAPDIITYFYTKEMQLDSTSTDGESWSKYKYFAGDSVEILSFRKIMIEGEEIIEPQNRIVLEYAGAARVQREQIYSNLRMAIPPNWVKNKFAEYQYDEQGHLVRLQLDFGFPEHSSITEYRHGENDLVLMKHTRSYSDEGTTEEVFTYEYEYDAWNNWTRKLHFLDGVPVFAEFRSYEYR